MSLLIIEKVKEIIQLLNDLILQKPQYSEDYNFLLEKFLQLENSIKQNNTSKTKELLYWNEWFAPRIVYDGTGEKDLNKLIAELKKLAK